MYYIQNLTSKNWKIDMNSNVICLSKSIGLFFVRDRRKALRQDNISNKNRNLKSGKVI